jgi:hypothetical protein
VSNVGWAINTGGTSLIGGVTITAGDDRLTLAAHGLAEGEVIGFTNVTGGAVGLIDEDAEYFVRNPTTDDFQISGSPGGAILDFVLGGAADVSTAVPSYAAVDFRRLATMDTHPASADRLGGRTGVRPHSTAAVTLSGTSWTVNPTLATLYPRETSTSGTYRVYIEKTEGTLTAADGSNPRIDALDVYIQDDDEDASGQRRVPPVLYTAGTPASSPTAPALAPGRLRLATFLVPAGGSPAPSIASQVQFDRGPGTLPVRTVSERPTTGMHEGTYIDQWDTDTLYRWDGSAFQAVASQASYAYWLATTGGGTVTGPISYTPVVSGQGTATFSILTGRYIYLAPKIVFWNVYWMVSAAGSGTATLGITSPTAPNRGYRQFVNAVFEGATTPSIRGASVWSFTGGSGTTWDRIRWDTGSTSNALVNVGGSDLAASSTCAIQGIYVEA